MSALSNLKRRLLSTAVAVPLRDDILNFHSTLAGRIFAHTETIPPASARAYAQQELERCVKKEIELWSQQMEMSDEFRARRKMVATLLKEHYLPALDRWEKAEMVDADRNTAENADARPVDFDVVGEMLGYSHRVEAWVHPVVGGDDYPITFYGRGAVNHDTIQAYIGRQGSAVMTDYSVTPL